jgi:hypothetical protein
MKAVGATGLEARLLACSLMDTKSTGGIVSSRQFLINVQLARERPKQKGNALFQPT